MMASTIAKPTVILIPGAWHLPSPTYDPVIELLNKSGYPTVPIALPSVGAPLTMADDVAAVRKAVVPLVEEQGKEVVIVMHSYGGLVGTEAAEGLARTVREKEGRTGGVIRLVYIAAMIPAVGESGLGVLERNEANNLATGVRPVQPSESAYNPDGTHIHLAGVPRFYNDLDPQWATELATGLQPQSFAVFFTNLTYGAYRDIPSAYLVCLNDRSIGWKAQEAMAKDAGIETIEKVESGHTPMLKMPDVVAAFIRRAAGEEL